MLTPTVQMRAAMQMRDEIFLHRNLRGFQSGEPATYKISVDEALKVVKWFEQQPETQGRGMGDVLDEAMARVEKVRKQQETQNVEAR